VTNLRHHPGHGLEATAIDVPLTEDPVLSGRGVAASSGSGADHRLALAREVLGLVRRALPPASRLELEVPDRLLDDTLHGVNIARTRSISRPYRAT
jgi:hypothetical protein